MEPRRPIIKDNEFYQRVLDRCYKSLIVDLDPTPLLDTFLAEDILEYPTVRDIQELRLTSEKNREILRIFRGRGHLGYNQLKQCLKKAEQRHLVDTLRRAESELELESIIEMEQRKMSEQREVSGMELSQRIPNERELMEIAGFIGMNWEFLGHSLGVPTSQIDHFKMDIPGNVKMQIYRMLLEWRQSSVSPPTMGILLEILKSARSYVNMEWEKIESIAKENRNRVRGNSGYDQPSQGSWIQMNQAKQRNVQPMKENETLNRTDAPGRDLGPGISLPYDVSSQYEGDIQESSSAKLSSENKLYFANTRRMGELESNLQGPDISQGLNRSDGRVRSGGSDRMHGHDSTDAHLYLGAIDQLHLRSNSQLEPTHSASVPANLNIQALPQPDPNAQLGQTHSASVPANLNIQALPQPDHNATYHQSLDQITVAVSRLHSIDPAYIARDQQHPTPATVVSTESTVRTKPSSVVPSISSNAGDNVDASQNLDTPELINQVKDELSRSPHDGRLLTLDVKVFEYIIRKSDESITKGGFGTIHICKNKENLHGLNIPVVVKQIDCKNRPKHKMMSITNEKLASRTMHFAIVPLLAMTEDVNTSIFYFLTPYLENGDLSVAIAKDTKAIEDGRLQDIKLTQLIRKRIIYQVHAALNYLHTPVIGFRGTIVHMDVKSLNIVMDRCLNARLIDFGLAREMNEHGNQTGISVTANEVPGSRGYYRTVEYKRLTIKEDYHNFGVVIRELLTGKPPYLDDEIELKDVDVANIKDDIQPDIWFNGMQLSNAADTLNDLAAKCIDMVIQPSEVKGIIESTLSDHLEAKWQKDKSNDKCEMCMVNKAVPPNTLKLLQHDHNCTCNISVCVACMRNSFLNPIMCHVCGEKILSIIGNGWGALLIAGNDVKNKGLAKGMKKDIMKVWKVLVSKCPLVMGIEEENVQVVCSEEPGKPEKMTSKLEDAINSLKRKGNIHTTVIYFSGHYFPQGFQLGSDEEFVTKEYLQQKMNEIANSYTSADRRANNFNKRRFFVFLDCCAGPNIATNFNQTKVKVLEEGSNNGGVSIKPNIVETSNGCGENPRADQTALPVISSQNNYCVLQVNASGSAESAMGEENGSSFTRFFVQALTERALQKNDAHETRGSCHFKQTNFITIHDLLGYINAHMNSESMVRRPVLHALETMSDDAIIAYNVDFPVSFEFKIKGYNDKIDVPLQIYSKITSLKEHLFGELMSKEKRAPFDVAHFIDFVDSSCIEIDRGPKKTQELDSIPQVMSAWYSRRDMFITLRSIQKIVRGMVLKFVPVAALRNYVVARRLKMERGKIYDRFILPLGELNEWLQDLSNVRKELSVLKKHFQDIRQGIKNAKDVKLSEGAELHLLFPNPVNGKQEEFMCFEIKDAT